MTPKEPSETERGLLAALADPGVSKGEIARMVGQLSPRDPFVLPDSWSKLAVDMSLAAWRRLPAIRLFLLRGMAYPCAMDDFERRVLGLFHLKASDAVDMTRAGALPFTREEGQRVFLLHLPIRTSVGPAGLYYAVREGTVRQADVFPPSD